MKFIRYAVCVSLLLFSAFSAAQDKPNIVVIWGRERIRRTQLALVRLRLAASPLFNSVEYICEFYSNATFDRRSFYIAH
jgi:hypothetical protein